MEGDAARRRSLPHAAPRPELPRFVRGGAPGVDLRDGGDVRVPGRAVLVRGLLRAPVPGRSPQTWQCNGASQGCPATRPLVGSPCTTDSQSCTHGDCNTIGVVCQKGTWHTQMFGCPISTRRDKQQVQYLGDDELRAIAEETLGTRLATYAYTFGDQGHPSRRLGFIIEDQPTSPAVAQGKDRVDLYGYASMAVATLQVQQRQIDGLREEVKALRRACAPVEPRRP